MTKPLMTDAEVAEARAREYKDAGSRLHDRDIAAMVRMLGRQDIDHEMVCVIGRNRIRFLGESLDRALDTIDALRALLKKLSGQHTAGCASQRTGRYHNLIEVQSMCDCPCGEIAKLVGGE